MRICHGGGIVFSVQNLILNLNDNTMDCLDVLVQFMIAAHKRHHCFAERDFFSAAPSDSREGLIFCRAKANSG